MTYSKEILRGDRVSLPGTKLVGTVYRITQCSTHGDLLAEVEWDTVGGRDLQRVHQLRLESV